ncbi:MAG: GNAT family N-acetyltransferase [Calothrix sp. CSU_2_0]|nr:GNAT family N-acetyltransferase [Calothrix sp. CSU_2_0]
MSEEIQIFTQQHLDECASLFIEVFNSEPWKESWDFEKAKFLLSQILNTPNCVGLILQQQNIILGFVIGYCEQRDKGKNFFLKEMCVRSNQQRQGIGTKLIQNLIYQLNQAGVNLIYLLTMKDEYTEEFYSKNSFQSSSRMIIMTKNLE